jgi:hypothetical protein
LEAHPVDQQPDNKNNMRILTNDYNDCQLLNLGTDKNGHGPYVIRQDGVPSGSSSSQEDSFLLRKDGTWVLNITAFTLPEKEQEQQLVQRLPLRLKSLLHPWLCSCHSRVRDGSFQSYGPLCSKI